MCIFDESATWKVYCWPILYNTAIAATNPSMYCKHGVHTNAYRIYPSQKGYTTAVFLGEGQCLSEVEEVPMAKPYALLRIHKRSFPSPDGPQAPHFCFDKAVGTSLSSSESTSGLHFAVHI